MAKTAAIVIPIYKSGLEWYEKIALQQAHALFRNRPICYMMPEDLRLPFAPPTPDHCEIRFPSEFFKNVYAYNALMLMPRFYQAFLDYSYILLYQLDAFAFSDQLERFCTMGYDYIGAPWSFDCGHLPMVFGKNVFLHVGNGGFSLRNVSACLNLLQRNANLVKEWDYSEDTFLGYCGRYCSSGFRIAPVNIARQFSWEFYPARNARKTQGILPFGCHAWHRRDADFYVRAFAVAGYDLQPFRNRMESRDLLSKPFHLQKVAHQRLLARLQSGRPVSGFLPPGKTWNFFVVGRESRILAQRLREEGVAIADAYCFEASEVPLILEALKAHSEATPLIVCFQDDNLLVELQKHGLECGYESFWQFYVARADRTLQRMMARREV